MIQFSSWLEVLRTTEIAAVCLFVGVAAIACGDELDSTIAERSTPEQTAADHALIKQRYVRFLTGTDKTFAGELGNATTRQFLRRLRGPISRAMAFDYDRNAEKPFRAFPEDPDHKEESSAFSPLLQQYVLSLAYGYCVNAPGNPHYRNPDVLQCYIRCLDYLHGRGVREGMTFHNNRNRMNMDGAPKPPPGAANLAEMELRMGALCQSVLADYEAAMAHVSKSLASVVEELNRQYPGRVHVIPVGPPMVELVRKVTKNELPGVDAVLVPPKEASERVGLYRDMIHPTNVIATLEGYIYYACLYGKNPAKLKAGIYHDEKLDRILRDVAWSVVTQHPLSGVDE